MREDLRTSLWGAVALAIGLPVALPLVDARIPCQRDLWFLFPGGPERARALLSTIATAMLSFTALAFSITVLVLQPVSCPRRTGLKSRDTP